MMMFLGMMSSAMSGGSFCRRWRFQREVLFFGGCGQVNGHGWMGPAETFR
jgi:hypothetical protein